MVEVVQSPQSQVLSLRVCAYIPLRGTLSEAERTAMRAARNLTKEVLSSLRTHGPD